MSDLLVRPSASGGRLLDVTPDSAGWRYVGFEVLALAAGARAERDTGERELCVVVVSGAAHVRSAHGEWNDLGGRTDPWAGPPDAAYLPPGTTVTIEAAGDAEVALCWAPAPNGGATPRVLPGSDIELETRGHGSLERTILPIPMADPEAEAPPVVRGRTPRGPRGGHPPPQNDPH